MAAYRKILVLDSKDKAALEICPLIEREIASTRYKASIKEVKLPNGKVMKIMPKKHAHKIKSCTIEATGSQQAEVSLHGTLCDRKLLIKSIPPTPSEMKDRGIKDAELSLVVDVSSTGYVVARDVRVGRSSNYDWLDNLAMDYIRKWQFEASNSSSTLETGTAIIHYHQDK
jgi:outer membrane biosynthesis protein TonB